MSEEFIAMPAHVSDRYGASEKGSLLHLVDDAVRALCLRRSCRRDRHVPGCTGNGP